MTGVITVVFGVLALAWVFLAFHIHHRRIQIEKTLHQLHHEKTVLFDFLYDLGECFAEDVPHHMMLDKILDCIINVTNSSSGVIYLKNKEKKQLVAESIKGKFPPPVVLSAELQIRLKQDPDYITTVLRNEPISLERPEDNLLADACVNGHSFWIANAEDDPRFPETDIPSLKLYSLITLPLKFNEEILGIIALANHAHRTNFTLSDFEITKTIAAQASFALYSVNVYAQLAEKKQIDRALESAREVQRIMLPSTCPKIDGYEISATNQPAQQLSGDYFDFLTIDPDHLGIVIGDVSGKGLPAAIILTMCRTVMRSEAEGHYSPAEVLRKVNHVLFSDMRNDMFVTMIYMILNTRTHTLTFAKAGHDSPILCKNHFTRIEIPKSNGMALGIDSGEVFDKIVDDCVVQLEPDDTILVYTNGINETTNAEGREFGRDQIKSIMQAFASQGVESMVKRLTQEVDQFSKGRPQNDDMTIVALQRK